MLDYHGSLFFEQKFRKVFFYIFLKPCASKHDIIRHMKSYNQVVIIENLSILTKKVSQHLIDMLRFNSSEILLVFMDVNFSWFFYRPFEMQKNHVLVAAQSCVYWLCFLNLAMETIFSVNFKNLSVRISLEWVTRGNFLELLIYKHPNSFFSHLKFVTKDFGKFQIGAIFWKLVWYLVIALLNEYKGIRKLIWVNQLINLLMQPINLLHIFLENSFNL